MSPVSQCGIGAIHGAPIPTFTSLCPSRALPGSDAQVDAALQALCSVLSSVATHHGLTPTSFDMVIAPLVDADSLVFYLMKGIRAEDARRRRLLEGKPLPEDLGGDEIP